MAEQEQLRVILAKLGLDGHDRGIKVVARMLRDAGMEIIYLGLRQTTTSIVAAAEEEDADAVGLSMHNAGHLTLAPRMVAALADADLDIPLIIGGIVPDEDIDELHRQGVAAVIGPGASAEEVVQTGPDARCQTAGSAGYAAVETSSTAVAVLVNGPTVAAAPVNGPTAITFAAVAIGFVRVSSVVLHAVPTVVTHAAATGESGCDCCPE